VATAADGEQPNQSITQPIAGIWDPTLCGSSLPPPRMAGDPHPPRAPPGPEAANTPDEQDHVLSGTAEGGENRNSCSGINPTGPSRKQVGRAPRRATHREYLPERGPLPV